MKEVRCKNCHKLLFKTNLDGNGITQIKCTKCGVMNTIVFTNDPIKEVVM